MANNQKKKELLKLEAELKKRLYKNNPKAFINECCKIRLEGGGIGEFKLRDYQEEYIDMIMSTNKTVCLKARQMGFSWVNAGLPVYFAIFNSHVDIVIMSKKEKDAIKQLKRVKFILNNLPEALKPKIITDSATELTFGNGSTISSLTSGEDSGRGDTAFFCLWDEAAFSRFGDEIRTALEPAANKGKFVVQSTPKGMGNTFHSMWLDESFTQFLCDWRRHPERDEAWAIANGKDSLDKKKAMNFEQEFNCSFEGSSMNVFDLDVIKENKLIKENPIDIIDGLEIYRQPVNGENYAMGVDVAEGLIRGDYSTIVVMAKGTNEVVAVYRRRISFDKFTKKIEEVSYKYNKALVAVEKNNHGHVVLEGLKQTRVPLYYQKKYDSYAKKWTTTIGWHTNNKTKPMAIDELESLFANKEIGILQDNILDELSTFIYEEYGITEKSGASPGAHDDLVLALAICVQCLKDVSPSKMSINKKVNGRRYFPDLVVEKPKRRGFAKCAYY